MSVDHGWVCTAAEAREISLKNARKPPIYREELSEADPRSEELFKEIYPELLNIVLTVLDGRIQEEARKGSMFCKVYLRFNFPPAELEVKQLWSLVYRYCHTHARHLAHRLPSDQHEPWFLNRLIEVLSGPGHKYAVDVRTNGISPLLDSVRNPYQRWLHVSWELVAE